MREKIVNNDIVLKYVFIKKQIVDNFIKLLFKIKFDVFRQALDLEWI